MTNFVLLFPLMALILFVGTGCGEDPFINNKSADFIAQSTENSEPGGVLVGRPVDNGADHLGTQVVCRFLNRPGEVLFTLNLPRKAPRHRQTAIDQTYTIDDFYEIHLKLTFVGSPSAPPRAVEVSYHFYEKKDRAGRSVTTLEGTRSLRLGGSQPSFFRLAFAEGRFELRCSERSIESN